MLADLFSWDLRNSDLTNASSKIDGNLVSNLLPKLLKGANKKVFIK
jgi:hypothetical protein